MCQRIEGEFIKMKCRNCGCSLEKYRITLSKRHPQGGFSWCHKRENELAYCSYHGCDKPEPKIKIKDHCPKCHKTET